MQAASAAAQPGLRAPSSLAVGAAVSNTKDTILSQTAAQQPGSSQSAKAQSTATPAAAAAAAAGKAPRGGGVSQPEVPQRSLEGFDEAVVKSVKALCQVCRIVIGCAGVSLLQTVAVNLDAA